MGIRQGRSKIELIPADKKILERIYPLPYLCPWQQ